MKVFHLQKSYPFSAVLHCLLPHTVKFFLKLPAWSGGKGQKIFQWGRKKRGRRHFLPFFREGGWSFYNPKIKIWKINYCENKIKLNNKGNSKNKPGKSFCLSTSFSFSSRFKNFLQLAFIYSNLTTKTLEQGV